MKSESHLFSLTCLMTSVPSLEGVVAWSLSESSTSMVLADAVSPLLSLLQKPWEYLTSVTRPVLTVMQKSHATLMNATVHTDIFNII